MRKYILTALFAFLLLAVGVTAVAAGDNFDITKVKVDDITADHDGNAIYVERGEDTIVEVFLTGTGNSDKVRAKAYIGGYEYDDVEALSDIFEVEPGVDYKKTLRLHIPEDLDASDDYTLYVRVYDDDCEREETFTLRIQEKRHDVVIQDILVRPGYQIEAGRPLFVTVRAENLGDKKEEDIRVTAAIPDLGVSTRSYIDELTANEDPNNDEEDSMSSDELLLRIPDDAKAGQYELVVTVEYNRGHDVVTATQLISVDGAAPAENGEGNEPTPANGVNALVTVDATSKSAKAGEEVAYRLMIANMGSESQIFNVEVAGEQLFAEATVDPAFITVPADSTGEVIIYVTPNKDANEGRNGFTARVKAGNEIVNEVSLTTNVEKSGFGGDLRQALIIGLIVLVVVLIVIGLIVAFSRMKNDDDMGPNEGQSYYYYPRY